MWVRINIDFWAIKAKNLVEAKEMLDNFADKVLEWVKSRTPEDTQDLLKAIWKTWQTHEGTKIIQRVKDKKWLVYTPFVEYWVWWNVYKYNKPKWTIFLVWVWAWMFRRTHFDLKDKFNENV